MRESIGTSFLLNFIVIFIVFIMAFLAATLSYYKAYRINNYILHSIEKFEGYNELSKADIKEKLRSIGYDKSDINCAKTRFEKNSGTTGTLVNKNTKDGYCIYLYWDENPKYKGTGKNTYYSYGVETYLKMEIPVIGKLIKLPVYSKTYNMYYFPES